MRTDLSRRGRVSASVTARTDAKQSRADPPEPSDTARTLNRGLDILVLLTRRGLGPTEISRALGVHRTTVHRLLRALMFKGFVQKVGTDSRYRTNLGYLVELAGGVLPSKDENWLVLAKSQLDDIRAQTGLSASLCMPRGKEMVYVMQILGREGLAVNNPPGTRRPMYCTAVGKAYLASLPAAELDRILETLSLAPLTSRTVTSARAFKKHLRDFSSRGYYVDDGEFDLHVRCVAATVFDAFGRAIGSIGVAGIKGDPAFSRVHDLGSLIVEKANSISRALGCDVDQRTARFPSASHE